MKSERAAIPLRDFGCAGGTKRLDDALREVPGVVDVYVNPVIAAAYVEYDPDRCTLDQLESAVREVGFRTL